MPKKVVAMDWWQPNRVRLGVGWLVAVVLAVMAAGCAATKDPKPENIPPPVYPSADQSSTEQILRTGIRPWLGTPHRMGGMNRRGIDCSGLAVSLYRDLFGIQLPRTTHAQMRSGRWVSQSELSPGDLLFFKPTTKYRHVGIYLGRGEFVHTSTRQGVMISRLDDDFWRSCYLTSRRLMP